MPYVHNALLAALEQYFSPGEQVVIRGTRKQLLDIKKTLHIGHSQHYISDRFIVMVPDDEKGLPGRLDNYAPYADDIIAYVCKGTLCHEPTTGVDRISALLNIENN
jgi:uncharacterized protein YyaL (SSP411 family)